MSDEQEYDNPWLFSGKPFYENDIADFFGFVYLITNNINGKKYIGKKFFWARRTLKPLKGTKKKRKIIKKSDWKSYYGSCKELLTDLKNHGNDNCTREIISLHKDERDVNYSEVKEQFRYNVLEELDENKDRIFYNSNILSRYFIRPEFVTIETRRKMSKSQTGKTLSQETKDKISKANKGKPKPPFTEEHKKNISEAHKGIPVWNKGISGVVKMNDDTKQKLSEIHKNFTEDHPAVKSRFKNGHVGYNLGKTLSDETKNKISNTLKETSSFVKNNPNSANKWITIVLYDNEILKHIEDFKTVCLDNNIKYNALRTWSKKHITDGLLHPKYNCKILELIKK